MISSRPERGDRRMRPCPHHVQGAGYRRVRSEVRRASELWLQRLKRGLSAMLDADLGFAPDHSAQACGSVADASDRRRAARSHVSHACGLARGLSSDAGIFGSGASNLSPLLLRQGSIAAGAASGVSILIIMGEIDPAISSAVYLCSVIAASLQANVGMASCRPY